MIRPDHDRRKFLWQAALVVVLAWLLREQFILFTEVDAPIRGDARQYVYYAWNLVHHGIFSMSAPGSTLPIPDNFRGPGYPLMLAAAIRIGGDDSGWYAITLQAQALLGAATVALGMALGRAWLTRGAALAAGLLMAAWPHSIAATGAVLSEVLFGFLLVLALWLAAKASARGNQRWAAASGATLGLACLVNPVALLFPPLAGLLCLRAGLRRQACWLVLAPLLIAGTWGIRNTTLPSTPGEPGRATLNFVEGSWPQYHAAYNSRFVNPISAQIMGLIDDEEKLMAKSSRAGLALMSERMAQDPTYIAEWYLLRKPWLLWDWDVRIGWGDVYYQQVRHSPLDTNPPLRVLKATLHGLNPLIFLLAVGAALVVLAKSARRSESSDPKLMAAALVALFCVYVTLLHTVFQAEPRYSIPYRPMELLLAVTALAGITGWVRARLSGGKNAAETAKLP